MDDEGSDSRDPPAVVAERLRRRGNAAFAAGKYLRAGELYRRALDALEGTTPASSSEGPKAGRQQTAPSPLLGAGKLHSNLAAVALQLGRPRAALASCAAALRAEPSFGRAAVRAATCYVRLGEWGSAEGALRAAEEAAARGVSTSADAESVAERDRVLADARAKRAELAQLRSAAEEAVAAADAFVEGVKTSSSSNSTSALSRLSAVLAAGASPYSLPARAAKARLLLALGRPSDAAAAAAPACAEEAEGGELAWQGWVRVQAAFFEGRLGDAAAALEARAQAGDDEDAEVGDENDDGSGGEEKKMTKDTKARHPRGLAPPSAAAAAEAAAALRSLLAARSEGNAAYAASKFADADAAYSRALLGRAAANGNGNGSGASSSSSTSAAALALAPPPPAFAALLLANRGAARARAGDVAGALSDCLSARALAPGYAKAAARAGDLLAEVGLLDAACREYEEGLAAVKSFSSSSPSSSSSSSSSTLTAADAALASSLRSKLHSLRSRIARAAGPAHSSQQQQQVDSFKLLGLHLQREKTAEHAARRLRNSHQQWYVGDHQTSAEVARAISDADVRAAYRRAALVHHPDKATTRLKLSDALCGGFGVRLLAVSASAGAAGAESSSSASGSSSSSSLSLSLHARLRDAADFVFKAVGQARDALADAGGREAEDRRLTAAAARAAAPLSHHHHHHNSHSSSYYGYGFDDFAFDARQQREWEAAAQAQAQANTRRPYAW